MSTWPPPPPPRYHSGSDSLAAGAPAYSAAAPGFVSPTCPSVVSVALRPVVNQCDLSVGGQDTQCGADRDAAIAFNQAQNISYEAWSPMKHCPFTDPTILKVAKAHSVSAAQVCLRWILDRESRVHARGRRTRRLRL
eukprot:SAG22_NODE_3_length_48349_cov_158.681180_11_plen_137_part_00